jgi:hypothetical protein
MFAKQVLYRLSQASSPFYSGYFGDGGLENYLPGLASNLGPSGLVEWLKYLTTLRP